jgi:hypothetical protein
MADVPEQTPDLLQHLLALDRVGVDDLPLLRGQRTRLVDDLFRDLHLADVVEECREFRLSPRTGVEAKLVGDVEDERDDVLAMEARVGVVGLDHVPEQKRGAAICMRKLERVIDARFPFSREVRKEAHQWQAEQEGVRLRQRRVGQSEAERGQGEVDEPGRSQGASQLSRPDSQGGEATCGRAPEVERELRSQGESHQRQVTQRRRRGAQSCEDEHWADRVPRAQQVETGTAEVPFAAEVLGKLAQEEPGGDEQRHQGKRRQEEHWNEDELCRDCPGKSDLELDPRREGVAANEREDDAEAGIRPSGGQPDE